MEFGFPLTADRALLAAVGAWSGTFPGFAARVGGIEAAWLHFARPLIRRGCAGVSERQGRRSQRRDGIVGRRDRTLDAEATSRGSAAAAGHAIRRGVWEVRPASRVRCSPDAAHRRVAPDHARPSEPVPEPATARGRPHSRRQRPVRRPPRPSRSGKQERNEQPRPRCRHRSEQSPPNPRRGYPRRCRPRPEGRRVGRRQVASEAHADGRHGHGRRRSSATRRSRRSPLPARAQWDGRTSWVPTRSMDRRVQTGARKAAMGISLVPCRQCWRQRDPRFRIAIRNQVVRRD